MKVIFKFSRSWAQRHRLLLTLSFAALVHVLALSIVPGPQASAAVKPVSMAIIVEQPKPVVETPVAKPTRHLSRPQAAAAPAEEPAAVAEPVATVATVVEGTGAAVATEGAVVSAGIAAPAIEAPKPAAPSFGRGDGVDFAGYRGLIGGRIASAQRYPLQARKMHIEGTTTVTFRVARDGHLVSLPVVVSPSHPVLDSEAVRMIQSAAPFPALPQGSADVVEFSLPIRFSLTT